MAIEVFPDNPTVGMSPRISFSHDLAQCDVVPVEQYIRTSSSSAIDFDFCVFRESFDQESSSADELFFDGKILPIQIKKRLAPPRRVPEQPPAPPLPPPPAPVPVPAQKPSKSTNKETKNTNSELPEEKHKSFWRFKRSTSLNCGSGYGRTLCPLPLLSRSNSTGSSASVKRSSITNNQKQNLLKHSSLSSSSSRKHAQSVYSSRPPLKKNGPASYGNGIKFNPVLNVPPANLFGLGYIFSGGKDRTKKKY
ncbi:hypothetical protein CDL12_14054 [Handroanthus impetiginosus]|uniref:Uncharacterized protein n=1 Tax=Handroanthus impetiginosus TaxID=429701 RepID=A0A2G9H727_9LAMI|nr:hypothetical protein CDL12_14054 [Handroanthus impetiginosus]